MAPTRRDFKLGIIGCGRISQSYVQAIMNCPTMRLSAVMDIRDESARSTAQAAECRYFTDLETFIRESGVDGAVICAPPNEHRATACALLQAGIHVLCEKPMATSWDDAVAMVNLATEMDLVLMMASKFRYVEDIIRAKAIIASGMLGEIQFYENRFCSKVNMKDRWNSDPQMAGGGVLIDNGTHSVDIVRYLLGPIRMVHAQEGKRIMDLAVEDTTCLSFLTQQNVNGTVYLSWSINIDVGGYINIYGTEGALSIGWKETKYQHNGHPEWVLFGVGYNKVEAFKNQVINFVETVRGSVAPIITMEDALASVEVVEAAYRSLNQQNWQEVEDRSLILNSVTNK
jgi:predicted dehydrogenase